jgi:hypothetical protein
MMRLSILAKDRAFFGMLRFGYLGQLVYNRCQLRSRLPSLSYGFSLLGQWRTPMRAGDDLSM